MEKNGNIDGSNRKIENQNLAVYSGFWMKNFQGAPAFSGYDFFQIFSFELHTPECIENQFKY